MAEKNIGKEKKGLGEWFITFQKLQAVALIGLAAITGSASLWTAAVLDSTTGVIMDAEYKRWKKKKEKK